jgi:hypothetical protein
MLKLELEYTATGGNYVAVHPKEREVFSDGSRRLAIITEG